MSNQAEFDFNYWWIGAGVAWVLFCWFLYDWWHKRRKVNKHTKRLKGLTDD